MVFFPPSHPSPSFPSPKPSRGSGPVDAAPSSFPAPRGCGFSPEKILPGHDKLCPGSVICVSSNFPLIHLYILDGKHSPGAAINHAAGATESHPASWEFLERVEHRGPGQDSNPVDAFVRGAVVWEQLLPFPGVLPALAQPSQCRDRQEPELCAGHHAGSGQFSLPKTSTWFGLFGGKHPGFAVLCSPAASVHPRALFCAVVQFPSINFLYKPPIDNLRAFSFKHSKGGTWADSPNDCLSCDRKLLTCSFNITSLHLTALLIQPTSFFLMKLSL